MRRSFLILLLLPVCASSLFAGCGSSSGAEESSRAEERTLTKKQFVKLAEAWCIDDSPREEADLRRYAEKHDLRASGGKPWEQERLVKVFLEHVEDKIAYFKSLPVPEGDEAEVRGMIEGFEEGVEKTRRNPAGLIEPTDAKKTYPYWDASYATTDAYGPMICGQP